MDDDFDQFKLHSSRVFNDLWNTLCSKQKDYGPRAINEAPGGPMLGVLVRMHDKYERLRNLIDSGADPNHESIRDTLCDLANYCVIGTMLLDGTWPGSEAQR